MNDIIFRIFAMIGTNHYYFLINMNYNELEKKLKKAGCYDTKEQMNGHPLWYSPKTGKYFKTSNHKNQEVATGTLKAILKAAGIK